MVGCLRVLRVRACRYILWEAEDQGLELPYACRMGCCTACAVRIKSGTMEQVEALGISEVRPGWRQRWGSIQLLQAGVRHWPAVWEASCTHNPHA